jgi:cystathionine beta-synthase
MITVNTSETLLVAYNRMRASDISQIPVLSDGKLVGVLDEEDLLFTVSKEPGKFSENVSLHMIDRLDTLQFNASKDELLAILSEGKVAIVYKEETFIGFVTKVDLINFYRNKLN